MRILRLLLPLFAAAALAGPARSAPTFAKDIAPLVFASCAACHRPNHIGPFPLTNYQEVSRKARQIVKVTSERIMPPWKPRPGHGDFAFDRSLTDAQIALFAAWVDAGKPAGNAADLPPLPKFPEGWQLGKPDIVLRLAAPYQIPAKGQDVYVNFPLPLPIKGKCSRCTITRPEKSNTIRWRSVII